MALLLSDRNRKVDHGSRVAMPYKNNCATIPGACISPEEKQIIHGFIVSNDFTLKIIRAGREVILMMLVSVPEIELKTSREY